MFSMPQPVHSRLQDRSSEVLQLCSFAREKKSTSTLFEVCLFLRAVNPEQQG